MTNWFNQLLVWDVAIAPNQSMTFGMNDMLFEGIFGWGKHCCLFVCCHDHSVRNSSNVSTSLPFLPYESNALLCAILTLSARLYLYSWTVFKVDSMPIFVTSPE